MFRAVIYLTTIFIANAFVTHAHSAILAESNAVEFGYATDSGRRSVVKGQAQVVEVGAARRLQFLVNGEAVSSVAIEGTEREATAPDVTAHAYFDRRAYADYYGQGLMRGRDHMLARVFHQEVLIVLRDTHQLVVYKADEAGQLQTVLKVLTSTRGQLRVHQSSSIQDPSGRSSDRKIDIIEVRADNRLAYFSPELRAEVSSSQILRLGPAKAAVASGESTSRERRDPERTKSVWTCAGEVFAKIFGR